MPEIKENDIVKDEDGYYRVIAPGNIFRKEDHRWACHCIKKLSADAASRWAGGTWYIHDSSLKHITPLEHIQLQKEELL